MAKIATLACLLTVAFLTTGCAAPPTVHIRHVLPAAVPAGEYRSLRLGHLATSTGADKDIATQLQAIAIEQFQTATAARSTAAVVAAPELTVDIDVDLTVEDKTAHRVIQQGDTPHRVDSLVRTIEMLTTFTTTAGPATRPARVQLRRKWNSVADPRVRGDLGLLRPDDPARVPDKKVVISELFTDCVRRFTAMVAPQTVTADVPLRRWGYQGLNPTKTEALAALNVQSGNYAEAARIFRSLLAEDPDNVNLQFNAAATAEAAGDLDTADKMYTQAASGFKPEKLPEDIAAGRDRVQLVRRHHQAATENPPSAP